MQTASMELYVTPVGSRFLVYRPLRPLAFVANAALVNLMAVWRYQPPPADDADPAARFLHSIGFFEPDSPAPAEPAETETFEPTIAVCLLTTGCNLRCVYCYASAGEQRPQALSVEPVSYTHLDVYKRQWLHRAGLACASTRRRTATTVRRPAGSLPTTSTRSYFRWTGRRMYKTAIDRCRMAAVARPSSNAPGACSASRPSSCACACA